MERIRYLDGHRGIAILLVACFHAFSRWPEITPYGGAYANFPLFGFGFLGVQLFFLISGYVILMTLEKCRDPREFMYRRWLRLFPAMLICTALIFLSAGFFHERPLGEPFARDVIPGLTFVDPYILQNLTGISVVSIEAAFWSLYVEMKFYVFAAVVYYVVGSRQFVLATFMCFLFATLFKLLIGLSDHSIISKLYVLSNDVASFEYFGWFAAGSASYVYTKNRSQVWYLYALSMAVATAIISADPDVAEIVATVIVAVFFSASVINERLQRWLSNPVFLFFGFISYPFYLIHENMMISLIVKLSEILPIPSVLLPLAAIGIVSLIAYLVAKFGERNVKVFIRTSISRVASPRPEKTPS